LRRSPPCWPKNIPATDPSLGGLPKGLEPAPDGTVGVETVRDRIRRFEAESFEKLAAHPVPDRPPGAGVPVNRLDETPGRQQGEGPLGREAPNPVYLGPGYRLAEGDDGKGLQQGPGKLCRRLQVEEFPDSLGRFRGRHQGYGFPEALEPDTPTLQAPSQPVEDAFKLLG